MKRAALLLLIVFMCLNGSARITDTITYSLKQKPRFFVTLASFNTFIDGESAFIGGMRTGLNFNQRIRFCLGGFKLANNSVTSRIGIKEGDTNYDVLGRLNLQFLALSADYIFYIDYPWQFTITPFQLGIGRANYDYISPVSGSLKNTGSETILLYHPEVSAQYNLFRWFGVGITTGYRSTLLRSKKQTRNLSAATFSFDLRLFLDAIYKELKAGKKEENLSQ